MKSKHILIPVELAQGLVNYLQTRPFVEVNRLIDALLRAPNAEPIVEEPAASAPEPQPQRRPKPQHVNGG